MALTDESGMNATMLVSPTGGVPYGNSGFGGFGQDGWWIILLLLLVGGGWGNGFGGNATPFMMNTGNEVQRGFDQSAIISGINGINSNLVNGFAQTQASLSNQSFNLSSQLANCCCENRLGLANLNSTILAENCADRAAVSEDRKSVV